MKRRLSVVVLILFIFALTLYDLGHQPLPWFDEGWVLSLARNWVVMGHYGHLLQGKPVASTILNVGFPVIVPIALSFRVFGIGVWQARLPSAFFLLITCALLYHLAYTLNGHRIGLWTLIYALLSPMYADVQPIVMGRQALGEISGVCYLLAGYAVLFRVWSKQKYKYLIPVVSLLFSLALQTKPQFLPFLVASIFIPFSLLWLKRRRAECRFLIFVLFLALLFSQLLSWGGMFLFRPAIPAQETSGDPYAMLRDFDVLLTYVVVLEPALRWTVFCKVFPTLVWVPIAVGLIYIGVQQVHVLQKDDCWSPKFIWSLILWAFAFSWFFWFVFLSIGFLRYLFPGLLVGNILAANAFYELTDGLAFGVLLRRLAQSVHNRCIDNKSVLKFMIVTLLLVVSVASLKSINNVIGVRRENAYSQVLEFLNTQIEPDALIETYESELFLFLEHDYHYPPDSIQHVLNRRFYLGEDLPLVYNPADLGIDYLVIGWSGFLRLYDPLLDSRDFELVYRNTRYLVYRRIVFDQ